MKRVLFLLSIVAVSAGLHAADRVALVIGNNKYRNLPDTKQLTSSVADAEDVAAALKGLGYTIVTGGAVTDVGRDGILTATEAFAREARHAEAAVFYFSGHGVQVGQDNYLLASDTPELTGMSVLQNRTVMLRSAVMVALEEAEAKHKAIILDCCRDNPFAAQLELALAQVGKSLRTKSVGEITGYGPGFYLAFATSPGFTADDGNGQRNSPFTAALLKSLPGGAGKDIDSLFRDVKLLLGDEQVSWTSHSLRTTFTLARATMEKEETKVGPAAAGPPAPAGTGAAAGMTEVKPESHPPVDKATTDDKVTEGTATQKAPPGNAANSGNMSAWEIVRHEGRDYVSVDSITRFYRFDRHSVDSDQVFFTSKVLNLKASLSGREMFVNTIKFLRSDPSIKLDGKVYFSRLDLTKLIDPVLRPSYINASFSFDTVVIDPAGGGSEQGVSGIYGFEKDIALKTALEMKSALTAQGLKVVMTREDDTLVSQDARLAKANAVQNGIYIGLRFEGGTDASGPLTYVMTPQGAASDSTGAGEQDKLAFSGNQHDSENVTLGTAVHASVVSHFKLPDRGLRRSRDPMLRDLKIPGVILIGGSIFNQPDARLFSEDKFRKEFGNTVAQALMNYRRAMKPNPAARKPVEAKKKK